jgi:hypothetical protein
MHSLVLCLEAEQKLYLAVFLYRLSHVVTRVAIGDLAITVEGAIV